MLILAGVTVRKDKTAEVPVKMVLPVMPPEVAVMVALPAAMPVAKPLLMIAASEAFDEPQVTCVVIS